MNLARERWITLFGEGPFPHPRTVSDGWRLEFPSEGSVNYVTTTYFHQNENPDRLVLHCRIIALPGSEWAALGRREGEGLDPNFRPILCAHVTDGEFGRWWPREGIFLANQSVRKTWEFDPEQWTSVFGKPATHSKHSLRAFRKACLRAQYGLTFGGGNAYGHGVRMLRGRASIRVTRFEIS